MNGEVIDIHVHVGGPEDPETGCYWSREFTSTLAYAFMMLNYVILDPRILKAVLRGLTVKQIERFALRQIKGSKKVRRAVVLALDAVYDKDGNRRKDLSHLIVPNSYVARLAAENDRVLFGASIHPYRRREEIDRELEFCIDNGAVLCKWICSSQQINPSHAKCQYLYQKLAKHDLPLLYHTGREDAVPTSNLDFKEFDQPSHLEHPLKEGVTVIAAHCSIPYVRFLTPEYGCLDTLIHLFRVAEKKGWRLYADLSAIGSPFIDDSVIQRIITEIPSDRLLLGSDFPIPVLGTFRSSKGRLLSPLRHLFRRNALARNYWLLRNMGFDRKVFTNAARLFSGIKRPWAG